MSFTPHNIVFHSLIEGAIDVKTYTHPLVCRACCLHWWCCRSLTLSLQCLSPLNHRRVIFTCYLLCSPLSILAYTSKSAWRVGDSRRSLMGFLSSPTCNETCCRESLCQSAHPVKAMYLSDSHCESGSMSCGLNGTLSAVYLPISCDKVPDIDDD